jgi:hypothetical protein
LAGVSATNWAKALSLIPPHQRRAMKDAEECADVYVTDRFSHYYSAPGMVISRF